MVSVAGSIQRISSPIESEAEMDKIRFGLIGSGWRAEFYIRIAQMLPELFELTAVLVREKEKGDAFSAKMHVPTVQTLEKLLETDAEFVVLSVKRGITQRYLPMLFEKKIPVLCETPPAEDLGTLEDIYRSCKKYNGRIQIAEQYFAQPFYAAWYQAVLSKKLGEIQNINISSLHGYHAASIIRRFLGTGFENFCVYGKRFFFDVTQTYGREGMEFSGKSFQCPRDRLTIEFEKGKIAYYDFSDPAQYHSFIRTRQFTLQGVRGEIDDMEIRYLTENNVPVTQQLNRIDLGRYNNQEWTHYGIMLGEEFLYKSPFSNARLNDDEIAVASCMVGMRDFLKGEKTFYSLEDALQDMYISIKIDEALANPNKEVFSKSQIWAV